jgi:nicotinamidase-related amidase
VGGRSGTGAVDDNQRLCRFIYHNLNHISQICPTLDTHQATQIFHSVFLINDQGEHPPAYTLITVDDIENGNWRLNPEAARSLGVGQSYGEQHLRHYVHQLKASGKYDLTIWPYHAMLGGIGHALVSAVEEAIFFHGMARYSQPDFQIKGQNPLTENYSALQPEILIDANGQTLASKNSNFIKKLLKFDAIIIAGQAKSHCVASTVNDLLTEIMARDKSLAKKVYLMEDCASPGVIPDVIDYTDEANAAYQKFANAGMHLVRSTDTMADWPGMRQ